MFIIEEYLKNECSPTVVKRAFQTHFNMEAGPTALIMNQIIALFRRTGSVHDEKHQGQPSAVMAYQNGWKAI